MVSSFKKLRRLYSLQFDLKIALYWHRKLQHRSAVSSNPDKLSASIRATALNGATTQNNAAPSKVGSNFDSPAPDLFALGPGPSALIDF